MADEEKKTPEANQGGEELVEKKAEETGKTDTNVEANLEDFSKFEPEVRKRPIDYIQERQERRIQRPSAANVDENLGADEEEELTPKAREYLDKEVRKHLEPITKTISSEWNRREISDFVAVNPEMRKYAPLVEKYMNSSGWEGVPAKRIFQMLDYEYSGERGADEAREQAKKANRARGGESPRAATIKGGELTAEDIAKLTPQQIAELDKRLARGEQIRTQ